MKLIKKTPLTSLLLANLLICNINAYAKPPVLLLQNKLENASATRINITKLVESNIDTNQYRSVKAQIIYNANHTPAYVLVYLFSEKYHRVDVQKINLDNRFNTLNVTTNYKLTQQDFAQQPGISREKAKCPDKSIQFLAFAPNDNDLELTITKSVALYAEKHGLKTIRLLTTDATRTNYLNYMACPLLVGNFYDGDANPDLITTSDGVLSSDDIGSMLKNQFKYKVTNIWLACEAYNDPMKSTMLDVTQSQKYAAGINNLLVGPSDKAAACAMKAALNGKAITANFTKCYDKFDTKEDQWGFGGSGSDYLGT